MRRASWFAALLGSVFLYFLLRRLPAAQIWNGVQHIGWRCILLLPMALFWVLPNTKAWSCTFLARTKRFPFQILFMARLAGDSVNEVVPGYLAGEPVRANLLAPWVPFSEAMSSVILAKITQNAALLLFLSGGLGLIAWRTSLAAEIRSTAWVVALMLVTAVTLLVAGSSSGLLGKLVRWLHFRWPDTGWLKSAVDHIGAMDGSMRTFYRQHKSRFVASVAWYLAGYVLGALELYVVLSFSGLSPSLLDALIMDVVVTLAITGAFFIPGGLGAYEFGHYVGASMIGAPPAIGISVALVRRFRQLFWLALGLALLSFSYRKSASGRSVDS